MKSGRVLCCIFFFGMLEVGPVQNVAKFKKWSCVLMQITNKSISCNYVIHI